MSTCLFTLLLNSPPLPIKSVYDFLAKEYSEFCLRNRNKRNQHAWKDHSISCLAFQFTLKRHGVLNVDTIASLLIDPFT